VTSYTDYNTSLRNQIKSILKAEFPQFQRSGRIVERKVPMMVDIRQEGCLRLKINPMNLEQAYVGGRTDIYNFDLIYTILIGKEIEDFSRITDFAEHILELFEHYRSNSGYWHYLVAGIDYENIPIPENYEGKVYGFVMNLQIYKGKITQ